MENKILIYNRIWEGAGQVGEYMAHFTQPALTENLAQFDVIVILGGTLESGLTHDMHKSEAMRLEREILTSLERGSLVCLALRFDPVYQRLLHTHGIKYEFQDEAEVNLKIKRSEFSSFLGRFGGTVISFEGENFDDIICTTPSGRVTGFAKKVGKGSLVFLPRYTRFEELTDRRFIEEFLEYLLKALWIYQPTIQHQCPSFIHSFVFPKEKPIMLEVENLQKEINSKKKSLENYSKLKGILWLRGDELVRSIMNFFNQLGVTTKMDEIYEEEDFWIAEQDKESVIVEVKGLDKNLKREHISKLDQHREARGKTEDFPALLIVNSFCKADSLKEKDQSIPPNVMEKADRMRVLIVRTLDLCNAYSLFENSKLSSSQLLETIKNETGWLKVTESGSEMKKK